MAGESPTCRSRAWRYLSLSAFYLGAGFVSLLVFDHFGFETGLKRQIQDGVNRLYADHYSTWQYPKPPARHLPGPAKVALVLWDDLDLRDPALRPNPAEATPMWPIPYVSHARVLNRIQRVKPRGVLIDILFAERRGSVRPLQRAVTKMRAGGTRAYFINGGGCDDEPVLHELLRATARRGGRSIATTVPVPRKDDHGDGVVREYYLFADKDTEEGTGEVKRECTTAALRMHLDDLEHRYRRPCSAKRQGPEIRAMDADAVAPRPVWCDVALHDYRRPLVLFWGAAGERGSSLQTLERFGHWFAGEEDLQEQLPFDVVIPAREVITLDRAGLAAKLADRLVVYGVSVLGSSDDVATAVHEPRVPGAAVHAMALDNLQRWQGLYRHDPIKPFGSKFPSSVDILMLIVSALFFPLANSVKKRLVKYLRHSVATVSPVPWWKWALLGAFFSAALAWVFFPPLLAVLIGMIIAGGQQLGAAFLLVYVMQLTIPFLLAALVGYVAFWCWGIAPFNFAAHIFAWIFATEVLETVCELRPKHDQSASKGVQP